MKFNKILGSLALTALVGASLSSCSNDMDDYGVNNSTKASLVNKAPKIKAYSGDHLWDSSSNIAALTRSSAQVTSESCSTTLIDRSKEAEIIEEYLPEKNGNLELHPDLDSDFLFYADKDMSLEFYPVYSQTTTPNDLGIFYWDADGDYYEVIVWEGINPYKLTDTEWNWSQDKGSYPIVTSKGVKINVPAGCTFGFYWKGNTDTGEDVTYYSASNKNPDCYRTDGGGARLQPEEICLIHAVTFNLDGKTYLGLEDWSDFDFQDWVFTCDQTLKTVDTSTFEPGKKEPETPDNPSEDKCDKCEHPNHDEGNCPDCGKFQGCNKPGSITPGEDTGFTYPVDPEDPKEEPKVEGNIRNEVEANLHGVEKNGEYLESHLSLHVRKATDVEVFIPVPRQYTCDADDMEIVLKHDVDYQYGNELKDEVYTTTYDINGNTVTLNVRFEDEGIRIWTDGINQDVIDYCWENYQDGITFEIWNYFNDPEVIGNLPNGAISLEELQYLLNKATIEFLDEEPDYYINAKKDQENDCTVSIIEKQSNDFFGAKTGPHNNGSELNEIYENKTKSQNSTGSGS